MTPRLLTTCCLAATLALGCGSSFRSTLDASEDSAGDTADGSDTVTTCTADGDCDDSNPCTDDTCTEAGTCSHENNTAGCDDGDECTAPDSCHEGTCTPGPSVCGCATDGDCADYEDGDLCNGTLVCEDGACVVDPHTIVECPETESACSAYVCVPGSGLCVPDRAPSGTACEDDSNICTDDLCDGMGGCAHLPADCDDGDACTTDACSTTSGCTHSPIESCCNHDTDCDDSNACTVDTCTTGHDCSHVPLDCNDSNLCTYDHCEPTSGCTHPAVDCDDGNVCTTDGCSPTTGCTTVYNTGPCDDGNPCTTPDTCDGYGYCWPGPHLPTWYRDSDGDGYGDSSVTTCASTRPTGYVSNDDDCCDSEHLVNPDQTSYHCSSFTCAGSTTPSWDYNCGGWDIERWAYQGECYIDYYGYCTYYDGWYSSTIPACGTSASFITGCDYYCRPITATRCQECI